MKAAVFREVGQPLSIEEVQIDNPKNHEVLVRTAACRCLPLRPALYRRVLCLPTPVVLGHESAGVVEKVGAEVTYVKPGDHVITCLSVFCGHCEFCTTGRPFSCANPEVERGQDETPRLAQNDGTDGPVLLSLIIRRIYADPRARAGEDPR